MLGGSGLLAWLLASGTSSGLLLCLVLSADLLALDLKVFPQLTSDTLLRPKLKLRE